MKNLIFIFLFCLATLSAKEPELPYLTSESDTLALIDGVINAYNGRLVQIDQDIEIQGSDPLEMTRFYDGGHHFDSEFGYGVGCSYPALIRAFAGDDKMYASVEMRMGCEVLFELKKDKSKGKRYYEGTVSKDYFKTGYTNCCEALLRGEPSIYAMRIELNENSAIVHLGNGAKRHYDYYKSDYSMGTYYLLQLEERSNGNRRHFSYYFDKGLFRLKRVWTTNKDDSLTLNWLDFEYNKTHVHVKGSNGQAAHYVMKVEKGKAKKGNALAGYEVTYTNALLSEASSDNYPAVQYEAVKRTHYTNSLFSFCKVKKPCGQGLEVEFNSDERIKKFFLTGMKQPLYTFEYHSDNTQITDARGALKKFEFSKRRLTQLSEIHRRQAFSWDSQGQLITHTLQTPSGQHVYTRTYKYDVQGNIIEAQLKGCITQTNTEDSIATSYAYSGENLLIKETHPHFEIAYDYVPQTNLLARKLTSTANQIVEREFYAYDKNGIMIQKICDDGSSLDKNNLQEVTYRLITEMEPQLDPKLSGITLPKVIRGYYQDPKSGQKHLLNKTEKIYTQGDLLAEEHLYDANDTYSQSHYYEYNHRRELLKETNSIGEGTLYKYDDLGNKIYEEPIGSGKKLYFTYDYANRLKEEREEHSGKTWTTSHEYDSMGNRISFTDGYGQKTAFQFDLAAREVAQTDPLGKAESKAYDALGNIIKITDKDGYVTETKYNIYGEPLEIRHPDGSLERYTYNLQGYKIKEEKRDGSIIEYSVDFKGRITEARTYTPEGTLLKTLKYLYKGPNLRTEIDAMGNAIHYGYDAACRKITKTQGPITTYYSYDALGRLSAMQCGDRIDITAYDALDRIIEECIEDAAGTVHRIIQYEYDRLGNRTKQWDFIDSQQIAESKTVYNSQSLPVLETDPLGYSKQINYRQTDHLEKEIMDPDGRKTLEIYDAMHRVREIKILSPQGGILAHSYFSYDGRGNRISHQEDIWQDGLLTGTFEIKTAYDSMGQKIREVEQGTKTTEWAYEKGRLKTLKTPDGVILSHSYDALGRLKEQSASNGTLHYRFTYDLNNNLLEAEDALEPSRTQRTYDALNRITYEKLATGFEFFYTYDELDRVKTLTFCEGEIAYLYTPLHLLSASRSKNGLPLYSYSQEVDWRGKIKQATLPDQSCVSYQWDKIGRCLHIDSPSYKQSSIYNPLGLLIRSEVEDALGTYQAQYDYDELHQLTAEKGLFKNNYGYDSLKNRMQKNGAAHQIDPLNQLSHDGLQAYEHDLNGRRTRCEEVQYTYDALGRLITILGGGMQVDYQYDALGRRISCRSPNGICQYLYQLDTEIGACEQGQLKEFRLVHKHATLAIELCGKPYAVLKNPRGDVCQLLDQQVPVSTYRYEAFGLSTHTGVETPWQFCSQRYNAETQLYHFEKREYDPSTGRWLTPDPLGFADGPNLFAYVHNNPLGFVDPYGLWREEIKDFFRGSSRGFADDTTWNTSSHLLGPYRPSTRAGQWGYHLGTGVSMAASLLYGGAELRLAKGALTTIKKFPTLLNNAKSLRETHKITKVTTQNLPLKQVFEKTANSTNELTINNLKTRHIKYTKDNSRNKIFSLKENIDQWLGTDVKMIKHANGNSVFISRDGMKRARFDLNHPAPHTNPHAHIEESVNLKWEKSGPIYPIDVPHF